jgi:hypothetical protein
MGASASSEESLICWGILQSDHNTVSPERRSRRKSREYSSDDSESPNKSSSKSSSATTATTTTSSATTAITKSSQVLEQPKTIHDDQPLGVKPVDVSSISMNEKEMTTPQLRKQIADLESTIAELTKANVGKKNTLLFN